MKRILLVPSVLAAFLLVGAVPVGAESGNAEFPTAKSPTVLAHRALDLIEALPPTPNTAWGLSPSGDQVMLTVSRAAPSAGAARLFALASLLGPVIRVMRTDRAITEQIPSVRSVPSAGAAPLLGGDGISNGHIVCSTGFNVVHNGRNEVLTAGHCTAGLPGWEHIGPSLVSVYPGGDYGVIRDDTGSAPGAVDLYNGTVQPITTAGAAAIGEQVCASGQTTKVTCGQVLAVDQTVDYGSGNVVHGLISTSVHTADGDSGGSLFDGSTALGMVSGGDGTTDYFQPLAPVLAAEGLALAPIA